jgi:hypothetical protein
MTGKKAARVQMADAARQLAINLSQMLALLPHEYPVIVTAIQELEIIAKGLEQCER